MKRISALVLVFAIGCGSSSSPTTSGDAKGQAAATAPEVMPNRDEAIASIREFFTDPGGGVGYLKVDVEQVSDAIPAPRELVPGGGSGWAFSVNMSCENVVGDRQQNRNWLIVIGREQGKAKVKDYYNDLTRMANSPAGRDWFAKSGFGEPTIE